VPVKVQNSAATRTSPGHLVTTESTTVTVSPWVVPVLILVLACLSFGIWRALRDHRVL